MEKISSFRVILVVEVDEEPVEVYLLPKALFYSLILLPFLSSHFADVAKQVLGVEFQSSHHVHPELPSVLLLDFPREERGRDEVFDEGIGLGEEGQEIHLLPAVFFLVLNPRVAELLEVVACEEVNDSVCL